MRLAFKIGRQLLLGVQIVVCEHIQVRRQRVSSQLFARQRQAHGGNPHSAVPWSRPALKKAWRCAPAGPYEAG